MFFLKSTTKSLDYIYLTVIINLIKYCHNIKFLYYDLTSKDRNKSIFIGKNKFWKKWLSKLGCYSNANFWRTCDYDFKVFPDNF